MRDPPTFIDGFTERLKQVRREQLYAQQAQVQAIFSNSGNASLIGTTAANSSANTMANGLTSSPKPLVNDNGNSIAIQSLLTTALSNGNLANGSRDLSSAMLASFG